MTRGDWLVKGFIGLIIGAVLSMLGYVIWYAVNDPGHGTITGKRYNAMYITCSGKPIVCVTHPECYRILYTDGRHDGDKCVSPAEYERYQIGDCYPAGER